MNLNECLPALGQEILSEFESYAQRKSFSAGGYVIHQGEHMRFLPIVLTGSVKVFSEEAEVQFLLYYVTAGETCIFSFAHIFFEEHLAFSAIAETESELLLLPMDKVRNWLTQYPRFNQMLLSGYQKHYSDLLQTTKQLICFNLEERLLTYLQNKKELQQSDLLKITHQEIATDLGTTREVISRLMKKESVSKKAKQVGRKIQLL